MKKFLIIVGLCLVTCHCVNADEVEIFSYAHMNMQNFWQVNGKYEQKVLEVGTKILNANKIDKRIAIQTNRN